MYSPSAATARTAIKDTVIDGQQIRKGEVVAMVYLAANRDPNIFPEPDTCKLDRHPNRHLAFGHGVHKCAGQPLARLQLRVALEELLTHTKAFKLDGLVNRHISFPEYGLEELPVRFSS